MEVRGAEGDSDLISIVIDWRNNIQFRVSLWVGHKWRDGLTWGSWVHNYGLIKLEAPSGKSEMQLSNKFSQRGRSSSIASIDSVSTLCLLTNV